MKTSLQNYSNSKAGTRRRTTTVVFTWLCVCVFVAGAETEWFKPFNVSYDHRALIIDGHRRMLISAGIHYPRATPEVFNSSFLNYYNLSTFLHSYMFGSLISLLSTHSHKPFWKTYFHKLFGITYQNNL